ncbi:restriction endonuclease subunit S, partial [Shewanella sp. 10N.286.45.A1]|uniref:restriction endonuclease subunit S n=1 Tax=Shewanella sp. 10N.286.45.A1 TaxID=3229694 RepID=UPI003551D0AF
MSEFGLLPDGWLDTQLGQIVDYGKATKKTLDDVESETWILELEDIEKNSSKLLKKVNASERPFKSTKNAFKKGDVLYGKLRPYLNKVLIAEDDGVCTTEIIPIDSEPYCSNNYLFYWLKGSKFLHYVDDVSYGVNMPRLGTKDGNAAPFRLPPLAEQKVIADKLDELLAQVESTKARLDAIPAILKSFRQSVLAAAVSGKLTEEWRGENQIIESSKNLKVRWLSERINNFEQLQQDLVSNGTIKRPRKFKEPIAPDTETEQVNIAPEWELVSVSEFAECLDSMRIPVKKEQRESAKGLYPYFGANGEVDKVDEYIFDDELVMVTEDETFYGRVKPIAYRYSGKCWVNNHAHVLKAPTKVANDYLCYSLMYYKVIPWLSGTTGRAKLTQAALNSLPIGLPPEVEQTEIVRRVEELFTFADKVEAQVNEAQLRVNNLTQSILAKAFRGELTADWRTANPELISGENSAEALLER